MAVDDHRVAIHLHFTAELAVRGVVLREMGIGLRVAQVVDRDDLDFPRALRLEQRPQDVAPDAPVTVDAHLDSHDSLFYLVRTCSICFATLSAVKPKCGNRSVALPEAPKRSMPITSPSMPTYFHHVWVAAALDGDALRDRARQHRLAIGGILRVECFS